MKFLDRLFKSKTSEPPKAPKPSEPAVTDQQIIDAMDPWTLACASGAENGSLGVHMSLDFWLSQSRENWLPAVKKVTGVSAGRIERVLRDYVSKHNGAPYSVTLAMEERRRRLAPSCVIGPGETKTFSFELKTAQ